MSEYILIDALNSDITGPSEVAYSLGPGPVYGAPVQIDVAASGGAQASNQPAADFGPFVYGTSLYATLTVSDARGTIIRRSDDNGATWGTQDDTAATVYASSFDGDHTLVAASVTTGIGAGELRLRNYDLATGMWGPVFGITLAPTSVNSVWTVWTRPDSSVLVFFRRRNSFPGDGSSGINCGVWSGASWTEFDAGANILALASWDATHTIVLTNINQSYMEDSGRIGVFFMTTSSLGGPPYWANRCFFQQINLDNSLGSFTDFPGQATVSGGHQDLEFYSGSALGRPVVLPDQDIIALPVTMYNRHSVSIPQVPCVYVGTPISAPVWSVDDTKYIDPAIPADDTVRPMEWGDTAFDGTTIWVVYASTGSDYSTLGRVRLCKTSNLASPADGWTAATVLDLPTAPSWFLVAGQQIFTPSLFIPVEGSLHNTFE